MDLILDIVLDAGKDTLALVPFLFLTYLVLETIEHMAGERVNAAIKHAGAAGPAVGAVLGLVPQCGFSAMAATLYAGRVVTLGTLVAVFLSTSDEMLPMLVAEHMSLAQMAQILGVKAAIGLVTGFALDALIRALRSNVRVHAVLRRSVLGVSSDSMHVNCGHDDHTGGDIIDEISEAGVSADHIHELCVRDHCGCDDDDDVADEGDGAMDAAERDAVGCGSRDDGGAGVCGTEERAARGHVHVDDGECERAERDAHDREHAHGSGLEQGSHGHDGHVHGGHAHDLDASDGQDGHVHGGHAHDLDASDGHTHGGHVHSHAYGRRGLMLHAFRSAVSHTVQVSVFIFLVTLVLVGVLDTVGEQVLEGFLGSNPLLAVFGSALVGLIPNCSASVVITQLYLEGVLAFGPMIAGTLVSAGVGYLVLFRTNRSARENILFLCMMYVIGVFWGLVAGLVL